MPFSILALRWVDTLELAADEVCLDASCGPLSLHSTFRAVNLLVREGGGELEQRK
jgi:hypothetical protein